MTLTKMDLVKSIAFFNLCEIFQFCFRRSNESLICQIPTFFNETKPRFPGTTSFGIISYIKTHRSYLRLNDIHENFDSRLCCYNSIFSKNKIKRTDRIKHCRYR